MKSVLLAALTAALGNTATEDESATAPALQAWVSEYGVPLVTQAAKLLSGSFGWLEIGQLAESASRSVKVLKSIFVGTDRAHIAQVVLSVAVREAITLLPESERALAAWVLPLIDGPVVAGLIEAAFQRLNPVLPVVDAPELPSGAAL